MPTFVHFKRPFPREQEEGAPPQLPYPTGWRGYLPDDVARAATEGGFTRQSPPVNGTEGARVEVREASESMTRDELDRMAGQVGLDPADYPNKGEIVEAINAA